MNEKYGCVKKTYKQSNLTQVLELPNSTAENLIHRCGLSIDDLRKSKFLLYYAPRTMVNIMLECIS
jgi:hypothetical protein